MLQRAATEGAFDCLMVGLNCLNQSGAAVVVQARRHRTGVIAMYAVRGLQGRESLQSFLDKLASLGLIDNSDRDAARLMTLLNDHGVATLAEAALRFCRHELGADVVLSGTGDIAHLEANISACHAPPLPEASSAEFRRLFANSNLFTGDRL